MKSKNYIIPVIAAVACLTGCSTNYEATDVRRVSHDMQDRQFGGKNIQFDAIVSGIYGDGVTLTSLDGQVMTSGRIQRKLRTTVDTLSRGDKVHVAGCIFNEGSATHLQNVLTIESISRIDN